MSLKLTSSALGLLAAIISATDANGKDSGCGYVVLSAPATKSLVEHGLIQTRDDMQNAEGETAARPTDAGREFAKTGTVADAGATDPVTTSAPAAKAPTVRKTFVIEDAVPMPPKSRQPSEQLYPFDALQIGQSFFVSNEDVKSGNAFKTLQSTINAANERFSEETGEFRPGRRDPSKMVAVKRALRKFEHRHSQDAEGNAGARVFRVEVPVVDSAE